MNAETFDRSGSQALHLSAWLTSTGISVAIILTVSGVIDGLPAFIGVTFGTALWLAYCIQGFRIWWQILKDLH